MDLQFVHTYLPTALDVVALRRTLVLLVFGDNLHRDLDPALAAKADLIINRTSHAMLKTPWLERETREAIDQICTELGRTKLMIVPFSEQEFMESPQHELLNCPHPGCMSVRDFQGELDLKQTRIDTLEEEKTTLEQALTAAEEKFGNKAVDAAADEVPPVSKKK